MYYIQQHNNGMQQFKCMHTDSILYMYMCITLLLHTTRSNHVHETPQAFVTILQSCFCPYLQNCERLGVTLPTKTVELPIGSESWGLSHVLKIHSHAGSEIHIVSKRQKFSILCTYSPATFTFLSTISQQ